MHWVPAPPQENLYQTNNTESRHGKSPQNFVFVVVKTFEAIGQQNMLIRTLMRVALQNVEDGGDGGLLRQTLYVGRHHVTSGLRTHTTKKDEILSTTNHIPRLKR